MLTNATDKPPSKLTQIEFTQDHVEHPDKYDPFNKEKQQSDRKLINFTFEVGSPICSITQEPLEVGRIIAVCNKCLSPFSKIALWKYFVHTDKNKCPMLCDALLNVEELQFSELEKILVEKAIIQDEIALHEEALKSSEAHLQRTIKGNKDSTKLKNALRQRTNKDVTEENLSSSPLTPPSTLNDSFLKAKAAEIEKPKNEIEKRKTTLYELSNEENKI